MTAQPPHKPAYDGKELAKTQHPQQQSSRLASGSGGDRTYSAKDSGAAKQAAAGKAAAAVDGSNSQSSNLLAEDLSAVSAKDKNLVIKKLTKQMKAMRVMVV